MNKSTKKLAVLDIAYIGMMVATLETVRLSLHFFPGVELVSLLIIVYTLFFKNKIFFAIYVFALVEGCLNGFGIWWFMYLYVWTLLAILTRLLSRQTAAWTYALLSGLFGLAFGALCSIPYLIGRGPATAFAWWVAGIPVDIIHGVVNFILCLILFRPLYNTLLKIPKPSSASQ